MQRYKELASAQKEDPRRKQQWTIVEACGVSLAALHPDPGARDPSPTPGSHIPDYVAWKTPGCRAAREVAMVAAILMDSPTRRLKSLCSYVRTVGCSWVRIPLSPPNWCGAESCSTVAVVVMDDRMSCFNCGDSKCEPTEMDSNPRSRARACMHARVLPLPDPRRDRPVFHPQRIRTRSMSDLEKIHDLVPTPASPRALTAPEFHQLAQVPPAAEWFANIDNPNTRRALSPRPAGVHGVRRHHRAGGIPARQPRARPCLAPGPEDSPTFKVSY